MEKAKLRNSNLELLRIVSMLLIIVHHYVVHGGFGWETITKNKIILDILSLGGKLGVNCFVLITGYFMVNSKMNLKKIIKIILEVAFYSIVIYTMFVFGGIIKFNIKSLTNAIFPITHSFYWFATAYVILYVLSSFINQLINSITPKQHKYLCVILIAIFCVIPTITTYDAEYSNVSWFVTLYFIASYIRKYPNKYTEALKDNLIYMSITLAVMVFCAIEFNLLTLITPEAINYITYFGKINSFPLLILSVTMFLVFKNIKMKNNKFINIVASSTFGVYLIHDNIYMRNYLWVKSFKNNNYAESPYLIVHLIFSVIAVFIICSIIDQIRIQILEKKIVDKLLEKIYNFCNKLKKADKTEGEI